MNHLLDKQRQIDGVSLMVFTAIPRDIPVKNERRCRHLSFFCGRDGCSVSEHVHDVSAAGKPDAVCHFHVLFHAALKVVERQENADKTEKKNRAPKW